MFIQTLFGDLQIQSHDQRLKLALLKIITSAGFTFDVQIAALKCLLRHTSQHRLLIQNLESSFMIFEKGRLGIFEEGQKVVFGLREVSWRVRDLWDQYDQSVHNTKYDANRRYMRDLELMTEKGKEVLQLFDNLFLRARAASTQFSPQSAEKDNDGRQPRRSSSFGASSDSLLLEDIGRLLRSVGVVDAIIDLLGIKPSEASISRAKKRQLDPLISPARLFSISKYPCPTAELVILKP